MARPIFATGDYSVAAQGVLRCVPDDLWFYKEHKFRHPLGIYNLSLQQVAADFKRTLDQYEQLRRKLLEGVAPGAEDPFVELLEAQRSLIHSLREHIDDCHMVLMCFVNPSGITPGSPGAAEFLRVAKFHELSIFLQPLRAYLDNYLFPVANKLKHRQGRLRGCAFVSGQDVRIGYYVEEVDENEVAGPSIELHGGNSAYSFARDIRFNFFHICLASEALAKAIRAFVEKQRRQLGHLAAARAEDQSWRSVTERITKLDPAVFPQEVKAPFPAIEILNDHTICLEYPGGASITNFPTGSRILVSTRGDGTTRSFRMPYLGDNRP